MNNEVSETVIKNKYSEVDRRDLERRLMESDKNLTIKDATDDQLAVLIRRLEMEERVQTLVRRLKRNNMSEIEKINSDIQISTETPIKDLYHYGILGMKWGVRRGSKSSTAKPKEQVKKNRSEDYTTAKSLQRKKLSEMSNKEIETLTRRLQLETSYRRLTAPTKSKGRAFLDSALKTVGTKVASEFNKQFLEPRIERAMTSLLTAATNRRRRPV